MDVTRRPATTAIDALRAVAAALPEVEEHLSHGMATWRVRGSKTFAMFAINHHGDGRVALWLAAPPGLQDAQVAADPVHCFVPPYVGKSGWLGLRLDRGIAWPRVVEQLESAWRHVAPARLGHGMEPAARARLPVPRSGMTIEELDPMYSPSAVRAVQALREICLAWPQTSEAQQFGKPVWRVGKRVFAQCWRYDGPVCAAFWVGVARQGLLTMDPRYTIPAYLGHRGWIALDVTAGVPLEEARSLALESYRHFAPARVLALLEHAQAPPARARAPATRRAGARKPRF